MNYYMRKLAWERSFLSPIPHKRTRATKIGR